MGQTMRLDKCLGNMGKGSRRALKEAFKKGAVMVNGKFVKDGSLKVDPDIDDILFEGEKVIYEPFVYLMLNKPDGYISATEDKHFPVVVDLVPEAYRHYDVFPVGRLDRDTEGLLLLTNDGALTHRLLSPKYHVPKVYFAKLEKDASQAYIEAFEKGITLEDGYVCESAELVIDKEAPDEVLLTIYEGKFHQVKRMFEAMDNKVTYLKRLKMGGLALEPALALGEIKKLTQEDLEKLEQTPVES
jgi:16S rRNA pseudouridine516 synthase